jgi:hypothetical protein
LFFKIRLSFYRDLTWWEAGNMESLAYGFDDYSSAPTINPPLEKNRLLRYSLEATALDDLTPSANISIFI